MGFIAVVRLFPQGVSTPLLTSAKAVDKEGPSIHMAARSIFACQATQIPQIDSRFGALVIRTGRSHCYLYRIHQSSTTAILIPGAAAKIMRR